MRTTHAIRIRPENDGILAEIRELFDYRELFYQLVWRDLKVRYKQTLLGVLWAVLQPALTALIFTIIFSRVAGFQMKEIPYWIFALSGFTFWTFANSSVNFASNSLVHHKELVTKIYFPRMIVPLSAVGAYFADLLLTLLVLFGGMAYFGATVTWKLLLVPAFLLFLVVIVASLSLFLSALNVRFRDVKFVVPFFLQVWLFLSPVFYSSDWVPQKYQYVFALNPLTGCLNGFRHILFGTDLDMVSFGISCAAAFTLFFVSVAVFKSMENDFADVL
ncbi:MAG: ABC transporter permease [Acidobacteriota bacterium]|nr:ABC transporter permease [Acidobacteriota bacterium]MDH3528561.1 ABC transporter permease [Acidobacteriota bacterium]